MKVLIADDHPLFVEGLRALLAAHDIDVAGSARDGLEALEQARTLRPDLILMDIRMPNMDGLAALRMIKAELPDAKVVMLTVAAEDHELFDAVRAGAAGYLLKTQDIDGFFVQLKAAAHGEVILSPGLASRILDEFRRREAVAPEFGRESRKNSLSHRELQVLTLVASGLTYKEVGAKLFLSERTIKYHMSEIVNRLHLANRSEAIAYARRAGIL